MKLNYIDKKFEPSDYTLEMEQSVKVLNYIIETKDLSVIKSNKIDVIEIIIMTEKCCFIKIILKNKTILLIDIKSLYDLKTHHYMNLALFYKNELLTFYDLLDYIDNFTIEMFFIKTKDNRLNIIDNKIYVNSINTEIKFNSENYKFVLNNIERWL